MKKYAILFASVTVLISAISYLLYSTDNKKQSTITGDKFYKVLFAKEDLKPLLEEENSNWKHLAKFEYAAKSIADSALPEVMSIYGSIADDKEAPSVFRELAQYLKAMNSFHSDNEKVNSEKVEELASSVVYHCSNKEALAIAKIHNNDTKGAAQILHSLQNDKKCPVLIKANAQELLRIYGN